MTHPAANSAIDETSTEGRFNLSPGQSTRPRVIVKSNPTLVPKVVESTRLQGLLWPNKVTTAKGTPHKNRPHKTSMINLRTNITYFLSHRDLAAGD